MECPTCRTALAAGPYRASGQERQVTMRRIVHQSGVVYDECPTCGGIFLDKAGLKTIEHAARSGAAAGEIAALAFKHQAGVRPNENKTARHCPRCREEMFERAWSFSKVDVCIECEGVWLDPGELDTFDRV